MKKKYTLLLLRSCALLAGMLVLMTLALLGAYALPGEPVRKNVERSLPTLAEEGMYPEFFGFKLFQMDNYTDTLMLFEAAAADDFDPLTSMMTNRVYGTEEFETFDRVLADYLDKGAQACDYPAFDYNRYWHGYLIILRPLLLVLPLAGIRVVNYLCFFALLAFLLRRLVRYAGKAPAVLFALSQLAVACFFIPHQMQFSWCFYIAYAACLALLRPQACSVFGLMLVLLASGGVTAYLDLLVTPIVTLGLPMTVWLLRSAADAKRQAETVLIGSIFWGVGYGVIWASKWILSGLVTGQNVLADAANQAHIRTTGDTWKGMELTFGNIFQFVLQQLTDRGLLVPLLLLAAICVALFALCLRSARQAAQSAAYLLVAVMPLAWFVLLKAHSIQHGWFTWRALAVLFFAGMLFVQRTCSLDTARTRIKQMGRKP